MYELREKDRQVFAASRDYNAMEVPLYGEQMIFNERIDMRTVSLRVLYERKLLPLETACAVWYGIHSPIFQRFDPLKRI